MAEGVSLYPGTLKGILAAIEACDQLVHEQDAWLGQDLPITDEHGTHFGVLRDEIGGGYCFNPAVGER